ncbi:MAG TPA: T9SS type A sorting domain-containing protein [Bacteroidetes bacterium]|nr:T9SS type A sorting domain-containing protein [Bacteroidota bacterium]
MKKLVLYPVIALIMIVACSNLNARQQNSSSDTLQFPFIERFTEGSLEINNWTTDCENWSIDNNLGNPAPSVRFNGAVKYDGEFDCPLTSDWIQADTSTYLRFDCRFVNNNYTGDEKLIVEIFDSADWQEVVTLDPNHNDWISYSFNLNLLLTQPGFKLRFRASGLNLSNIEYWALDNIFIYNGIKLPEQLEGSYYWGEDFGVKLKWIMEQPIGEWGAPLSYSWDQHCSDVGLVDGGNWAYAIKWDSLEWSYDSSYLYIVDAYINDTEFDSLVLKVWKGQDGDQVIYSRNVTNEVKQSQWNSFNVIEPVLVTNSSPTWFGFKIYGQDIGTYPVGISCNEAVTGYGDLIKTDLDSSWNTLYPSIDHNWCMMLLFDSNSSRHVLNGYKIFRRIGDDSLYRFYDYVERDSNEVVTYYDLYPDVDIQTSYSYQVSSAWINHWVIPEDTLFSLPGYAKINGDDNFVTILVTNNPENIKNDIPLSVYPNPFSTSTTIEFELQHPEKVIITICNHLGEQIDVIQKNESQGRQKITWCPVNHPAGIYYFQLQAGEQLVTGKMVLMR